jgi:DNA-binding transcriptional LysR family regulator
MDTLTGLKVFRKIVESGSFVAAAEQLELSPATISKHLMMVEKRLGARLVNRNNRTLNLTESGRLYFERCKAILDELCEVELEVASFGSTPRGTLRITAPSWFAGQELADTLAEYQRGYPEIVVDISFEDRIVDLVEEGYDLALRITPNPESLPGGLIARAIRPAVFYVGASREYLNRHGVPEHPEDLAHHDLVAIGNLRWWMFSGTTEKYEVPPHTVVRYRSMYGVVNAVAAGMGLAPLPAQFFEDPEFHGLLVPILTNHPVWDAHMYLLYISRKHIPPKIRSFLEFVLETWRSDSPLHPVSSRMPGCVRLNRESRSAEALAG